MYDNSDSRQTLIIKDGLMLRIMDVGVGSTSLSPIHQGQGNKRIAPTRRLGLPIKNPKGRSVYHPPILPLTVMMMEMLSLSK
jgi:hypothetical protein